MTLTPSPEVAHLRALSQLTLNKQEPGSSALREALNHVAGLDADGRADFVRLADSHHVLVRALQAVHALAAGTADIALIAWTEATLAAEQSRIDNALRHLDAVCREMEAASCSVVVMKSLDHWPDLGNDLDLFSPAPERSIVRLMREKFHAHLEPRSWGDRLANKWNFALPGLREAIEVHAQRLGQTGEHTALARRVLERAVPREVGGYVFRVPAPEERIIIATLQRMYRHFYFRICDVLDTAALVETGALNFAELRRSADLGGIWPGVATFLVIVSDYVKSYRGEGVDLPREVLAAAKFGGNKIAVRGRFLRFPVMPEGAGLYGLQMRHTAAHGNFPAALRLSLLPPLASMAALAYRVTGSDKGIW
ncbi:MAG TPA: nucleotidyltransferase family protein [Terriglobales bacterium]|nr:nucleotidyltransferase family protein [Terriglobales bacterium]